MFPGSVIRKLSHSEEVFAQYEVFTSMTIQLRGVIDVDALSDAFDALLETHPVLAMPRAGSTAPSAGGPIHSQVPQGLIECASRASSA